MAARNFDRSRDGTATSARLSAQRGSPKLCASHESRHQAFPNSDRLLKKVCPDSFSVACEKRGQILIDGRHYRNQALDAHDFAGRIPGPVPWQGALTHC
jgi:hypothetical protein